MGWAALEIRPGRGRPSRVDGREVEEYVRQSPCNFGVARSRWILQLRARFPFCPFPFAFFQYLGDR